MKNLEKHRKEINSIDKEMINLFEKRMQCVKKIAQEKLKINKPVLDPDREKRVIENALHILSDKSLEKYTTEFLNDLMEVSKRMQADLIPIKPTHTSLKLQKGERVGYQGAKGSYTQQALKRVYGENIKPEAFENLDSLFKAVSTGKISSAVVPYENSSTGGVNAVTDLMRKHGLYIKAETEIPIQHCLLGVENATQSDIKYVYSHPQGLSQCSDFFNDNPNVIECSYSNTAFAARDVANWNDIQKAAIASPECARIYGLYIIKDNIHNNNRNKTRFIVISRDAGTVDGAVKTSILFTSNHKPGALFKILEAFYKADINITRIESRPNPERSFEYFFYLDFMGSVTDQKVVNALEGARQNCGMFKIMGSYKII